MVVVVSLLLHSAPWQMEPSEWRREIGEATMDKQLWTAKKGRSVDCYCASVSALFDNFALSSVKAKCFCL